MRKCVLAVVVVATPAVRDCVRRPESGPAQQGTSFSVLRVLPWTSVKSTSAVRVLPLQPIAEPIFTF
jgi:hypothetical protein